MKLTFITKKFVRPNNAESYLMLKFIEYESYTYSSAFTNKLTQTKYTCTFTCPHCELEYGQGISYSYWYECDCGLKFQATPNGLIYIWR